MKITAIKQQVKRQGRYSIYVDGKYSFSLGENELIDSGIRLDMLVTAEDITRLQETSQLGKLHDKILNLLSFRPRSQWEIRDYLRRKKQPKEIIEKILNKLSVSGQIDDHKFARWWVESRRASKSISRRKLWAELKQKHIDTTIIDEVLAEDRQQTNELEVLRELVDKKAGRYPDRIKLMQYLARQGYKYDDIKTALDEQQ